MTKKSFFKNTLRWFFVILCAVSFALSGCSSMRKPASKNMNFLEQLRARTSKGDLEGALALFDALPPEEAAKSQNIILKSSILISAGRTKDARSVITPLTLNKNARKDVIVEAKFVLSSVESAEGNKGAQKALLDDILIKDPAYIPALNSSGYMAMNSGNLASGARLFDRALAVNGADINALIGRASVYRLQKKSDSALELLNKALSLAPKDVEALELRARILRESGKPEDALSDLNHALSFDKNNYWALYDKGRALLDLNRKKEALAEFEKAEKIKPDNFISYVYSAGIRDDIKDWDKAAQDYEILSGLKPDYYYASEMLGVHRMRQKEYMKARNAFMKAYAYAPAEYGYALLAVINGLYAGEDRNNLKPFMDTVMKKMDRSKLDYYLLRLFYDGAGDGDVTNKVSREKDPRTKAKNLFYLACYFDLKGKKAVAEKYFEEFRKMNLRNIPEWRIDEWITESAS